MFSHRLDWRVPRNRLSEALEERRRSGAPLLDLTQSNPTEAGVDYPDVLSALAAPGALRYEPAAAGMPAARAAVAEYYRERGVPLDPAHVLLTASTSESYAFLFKLLADPGDEVLTPRPSYPLFEFLAGLESVRAVPYSLAWHRSWTVDLASVEAAVTPRTRAIVVVNPNNPTGSYLKRAELDGLVELCAAKGIAIVSDEVFADFAFGSDPRRVATLAAETRALSFSLSGLSKVAGLPQMKLGWIAVAGPDDLRDAALQRLEWIADTFLSVAAPVQHALPHLLGAGETVREQIASRTRGNLTFLRGALPPSAALLEPEGGWYAPVRVPRTRSEEEWCLELLERDGVLTQPGFFYDFESEAYLVLSLLTEPAAFREGVARLAAKLP